MYLQERKPCDYNEKIISPVVWEWQEIRHKLLHPITFSNIIELHLIRHAETEINAAGRITGTQDSPLTLNGKKQAINLGKKLDKHYDIAFCSELQRSQNTLKIALENSNTSVGIISTDKRLNERSLGVLEGQKRHSIAAYAAGDLNYAPTGGEPYNQVALRILSFLLELSNYVLDKEVNKVLICGHMGVMRILVGIIEDQDNPVSVLGLSFSNAEVFRVTWNQLTIPAFLKDIELK